MQKQQVTRMVTWYVNTRMVLDLFPQKSKDEVGLFPSNSSPKNHNKSNEHLRNFNSIIFKGVGSGKEPDKNLESTDTAFIKDLPGPTIKLEPKKDDIIGTITVVTDPSLQKLDDEESPTGGVKDMENKALDE